MEASTRSIGTARPTAAGPILAVEDPTMVFESLRALLSGGAPSWASLGGAALLALGDVIVAAWVFARVHRHAVRTGLIARYSAESVS